MARQPAMGRISVTGDIDDFRGLLARVGNGLALSEAEAERAFDIMMRSEERGAIS